MKNEYIKPENALAVSEIFKRHNLHPFMYKIERDMLYAVYSDFSNRAMKDFYAVRRDKYDKPFIKCSDLSEAADSGTVYFTILDSYEKLLPDVYKRQSLSQPLDRQTVPFKKFHSAFES